MFLSSNEENPGYDTFLAYKARGLTPKIFLDGAEIQDVNFVDDLNGYVIVAKKNEKGQIYAIKKNGEHIIATETKYGTVVIEIPGEYRTLPP